MRKQHLSLGSEHRPAVRTIEQSYAELPFQVGEGLADDGLSTSELAPGAGKTSLIRRGDESAQLIERDRVEHVCILEMISIEKYRLPR